MHTWWMMDCRYCLIYQLLFVNDVRTPYFLKILKSKKRRMKNGKGHWQKKSKCHLFTLNLKSQKKAMANFQKGKSSEKYRWPFLFWQSLFHTVKEWKSLAHFSLKCRFLICEARAKLKWNLKVDSPAVTPAYSSKSPINFAKISLPINLDMEVQFVHWPWLFPNTFLCTWPEKHWLHK